VKLLAMLVVESLENIHLVVFRRGGLGGLSRRLARNRILGKWVRERSEHLCKAKLEEVEEERIEVTCDGALVKDIIAAIKKVHPYEEVALDVYRLERI